MTRPGAMFHGDGDDQSSRAEKMHEHHRLTLWVYWTVVILGFWMLVAPVTFGYLNPATWVDPGGGRGG